ncbi:hypothetical protein BGZ54_008671 [Gamsiella multidivaricata]|nr:hypothetical protein BGZ54_008671 [Gamsiella multidivaricata]
MHRRERCCGCIPFRLATFLGALLLGAFGAAGTYLYFTNSDLPKRAISVGGISVSPLASGQALWYYVAAVSVLAAAVGLFGMVSALAASRRFVKAFEAFYVLSLMTQFALIIWALIWCKQNQTQFDTVCTASKDGNVDIPLPGFVSDWSCQKIFTAGILTIGVGGIIWIAFNFYMTNRVIHYARELFAEKANRYKVLGEAATKELDREQQIPLNYTNVGSSMNDREGYQSNHPQQPSYRDEIEYKDPRGADAFQQSRAAAAAGFGAYGHDLGQHQHQQPVARGFSHRDSAQGLDLVNPYYGEHDTIPGPTNVDPTPIQPSVAPAAPFVAQGPGQSFVHASTNKIPSPFDEDEPVAPAAPPIMDGIKVPLPASPRDGDIVSPTGGSAPTNVLSPSPSTHQIPAGSHSGVGQSSGEPYQF